MDFDKEYVEKKLKEDIEKRFVVHPPQYGQTEKYDAIREKGKELALLIYKYAPCSQEFYSAIEHVDKAVMMANAAIARHGR